MADRALTALLIKHKGHSILVDCGEGTQVQLRRLGWGIKNIGTICLTHFHVDHIAGLPGVLSNIANSQREDPVLIIGPLGLKRIVESLMIIIPSLPYKVNYIEVENQVPRPINTAGLNIYTIPLQHRDICLGYSFEIQRPAKFDPEKAQKYGIPARDWARLQAGEQVDYNGTLYTPSMVVGPPRKGIKVCYCTDTRPIEALVPFVQNADLLVCEGMYGNDDKLDKAKEKGHMLFSEAATLAKKALVKELWLTHFSPEMVEPHNFIDATKKIFKYITIGSDLLHKTVEFTTEY